MTLNSHKRIYAGLNAVAVVGSFGVLISILNLNQPWIYARTAFIVWIFFMVEIALLYDLHFKSTGNLAAARKKHASNTQGKFLKNVKIGVSAILGRCTHLFERKFISQWLHYLILPGMVYWGGVFMFYLNFGFPRTQELLAVLCSTAFFFNYIYLKEIFRRNSERVDHDVFVILSVVKIFASVLVFSAAIGIVKSNCLNANYLISAVFCLTFFLIYQALFQHRRITLPNLGYAIIISAVMAILGFIVLVFWNYNYLTAGVFLTACYNLLWGIFHYHLDRALTWQSFWEILVISIIVAGIVLSVTNFKARLLNDCQYHFELKIIKD